MTKQELSGHHVVITPYATIKWGGPEVEKQAIAIMSARWALQSDIAPHILAIADGGYVMETKEKLAQWNWHVARDSLKPLWDLREEIIYPPVKFDPETTLDLILAKRLGGKFLDTIPTTSYLRRKYGDANEATHGDPTADNTMANRDGSYCFIDWQPCRKPYMPAHRDVDYGKMLQSLIQRSSGILESLELLRECPDAWFWAAVHFIRIMNRTKRQELRDRCVMNIYTCMELRLKVLA